MNKVLDISNLYKKYEERFVLSDINISLDFGESLAVIGPSGSGKSTLLQIIGLLDKKTSGKIFFQGNDIDEYSDNEKTLLRRNSIGFVYQFHYLINELTIFENIFLPFRLKFLSHNNDIVNDIMYKFGIEKLSTRYPHQISGGERQRAAIARALVTSPSLIVADEPTGNLDVENANIIKNDLLNITKQGKTSLILATHDSEFASTCSKIITLR